MLMIALYTIADLRRGEELRQDQDQQMIFPRRAQVTVEHLTCRYIAIDNNDINEFATF